MRANLLNKMRNMSEEELYNSLYSDHLTGLLNRRAFESNTSKYVALVDLDSLKYINDTLGHAHGDAQLCAMGYKLADVFGNDHVYRLGGDEFVVRNCSIQNIINRLERLRQIFTGFSYGIGESLDEADEQLNLEKSKREAEGVRAPRGTIPPWAKQTEKLQ